MVKEICMRRVAALRASFQPQGLDGLLVSHLPNIRYLTGFTGTKACLLVTCDACILIVDGRYYRQASYEAPRCLIQPAHERALCEAILVSRLKRVGFESGYLSFYEHGRLEVALGGRARLLPSGGLVEALRLLKDPDEAEYLRRAARISAESFEEVLKGLRPGIPEIEIAARLEYQFRARSGSAPAFETLVAAGPRSALIHARPTRRTVDLGEPLLIDAGAVFAGYHADMTRTVTLGQPKKRFLDLHGAVSEALDAAIQAARPGVSFRELDAIARKALASIGTKLSHGLGHGVGLEIHEGPWIDHEEPGVLQAGMAIALEPGLYFEGYGGMRLEETILVTEQGAEVLTQGVGHPRLTGVLLLE